MTLSKPGPLSLILQPRADPQKYYFICKPWTDPCQVGSWSAFGDLAWIVDEMAEGLRVFNGLDGGDSEELTGRATNSEKKTRGIMRSTVRPSVRPATAWRPEADSPEADGWGYQLTMFGLHDFRFRHC